MKTCAVFAVFLMLGAASGGILTNDTTVGDNLGNGTAASPNTTTDALTIDPTNSTSNITGTNDTTVGDNLGNGTAASPNTTTDALTIDPTNSTSKTIVQPIKIKRIGEEGDEKRHSSKSPNQKDSHTKKIHVEERENSTPSSTIAPNQTANSTRKDNDEGDKGRRRSSITTPTSTVLTVSRVG